ncbi:unnamed protein product [Amoebophrya sp. A120]|nr:unnamed protein product [Amoebophrya sp. A120]|eukprot:GSA120T00010371001.1
MTVDTQTALLAGGFAGTTVDVALFPMDTLKTRLQAKDGFWKSGGFSGIYRGLSITAIGSWPNAALFFATYEFLKPKLLSAIEYWTVKPSARQLSTGNNSTAVTAPRHLQWRNDLNEKYKHRYNGGADAFDERMRQESGVAEGCSHDERQQHDGATASSSGKKTPPISIEQSSTMHFSSKYSWLAHSTAAASGEIAACLIRVPTENIKQKMQVTAEKSLSQTAQMIFDGNGRGSVRGFYAGLSSTIAREVPFAFIQFPIYEGLKLHLAVNVWKCGSVAELNPLIGAACGSFGGAIAAFFTCPMDVAKTRLMTAKTRQIRDMTMRGMLRKIVAEEGFSALFCGVVPRVLWVGAGGFIFFGAYEFAKSALLDNAVAVPSQSKTKHTAVNGGSSLSGEDVVFMKLQIGRAEG